MTLRAIFFDIDDTLFSTTEFALRARERAIEAMIQRGLRASKDRALAELHDVVAEFGSNDDRHFNRLLERLPVEASAHVNKALLVTAGVMAYHETKWRELQIRPEAQDLLEFLAATDLRLGVISAGLTSKQMEKILRLGLDAFMDPSLIFITDQQGFAKSNFRLYERAVHAAGVQPHEAMHIGDRSSSDIDPAKRAGLVVVWHRGSGKYSAQTPAEPPDHTIDNLAELRPILERDYAVGSRQA